jgi:alanine-synthesizing transaminase
MVTRRIMDLEYAIRDIAIIANEVAKSGKKVYNLNIGDPVRFDFKTPEYISQASSNAALKGKNFYVDSMGVPELREEIAKFESKKGLIDITAENIVITSGVTEGIIFILAGLIENGNEVLIPGPTYPLYINYTKFFDGNPIEYELDENYDWEPNVDDLRKKITKKTQAILICSPNNPTGGVYSSKQIQKIIDLAGEYNLPVLSDEIYDQIIYEKGYTNPASLSKDVPIIGMNGFSKTHLITGWRLGYIYYHDPNNKLKELKEGIAKMARSRLCSNSIAQYAAIEVLKNPGSHTAEMVKKLRERRDYSHKRLQEIDGINCVKANGAFYLFPRFDFKILKKWKDDKDFVISLLRETGVCTVFGSGFGNYGRGHVRFTFLPNMEILETIFDIFEDYVR